MNSKPTFNLVRLNNAVAPQSSQMNGGFSYGNLANEPMDMPQTNGMPYDDDDQFNLYKAKKYHYKCQAKLRDMMSQGKQCPAGFEKYLKPFSV